MRSQGNIAIAGAGYVGLTSAACFCEMGHQVTLVEVDPERLALLQSGGCPIHEPDLPELLRRHLGRRLHLTPRLEEAVPGSQALFVCVGTPARPSGSPDLRAVRRVLLDLNRLPDLGQLVVVFKSTVPPGTCRMAHSLLKGRATVASNPEFLREGRSVHDFFHPDRIVVGCPDEAAALQVAGLYSNISAPLLVTGWEEAELIKYATNAFLATKISFANEIAAVCEPLGADAQEVLKGLGLDHRVGAQFLRPGPGYGGSCLPKDVSALLWQTRRAGIRLDLIPAAERANARQRLRLLSRLSAELGGLPDRTVAVWGLTFKAGTDDIRGSPALDLIPRLLRQGAHVRAYDPVAQVEFARQFPPKTWPGLTITSNHWDALTGADALFILTEWDLFGTSSPAEIRRHLKGDLVVDGRNCLDPSQARAAGLRYYGVGRPIKSGS